MRIKILILCSIVVFLTFVTAGNAVADAEANARKLNESNQEFLRQKRQSLPPCPLNDEEIKDLAELVERKYQRESITLTPLQVTLMTGVIAGYGTAREELWHEKELANATGAGPEDIIIGMVPEFDMGNYCRGVAASTGGGSTNVLTGCINMEKEAKASLLHKEGVPEHVMRFCSWAARAGERSYAFMQGCVDNKMNKMNEQDGTAE